ncbi:helix-turn-helix domain-containing protein [Chryseolinea soli]|uniref:AraC family transcriptional regulator n=1 Tax=Chryseolinea soli TaxID=2321403 RepID=A0A385SVC7_9BACT|nr:AraC family transcriptional regulator [Chryseolinea soli]AYB35803.1 AraC family transcriptional regulator [Chryseolinea soli]
MKANTITSCYIGPQISPEQFIAEHFFLYLAKGTLQGYDGHKNYTLKSGEYCVVRKNHLARYNKQREDDQFEKIIVIFDEAFLKDFRAKHRISDTRSKSAAAFIKLNRDELIPNFVRSLAPYYNGAGKIDETFSQVKREELLLILLKINPELTGVLFDFGSPQKLNLEEFMNRNYKFNVSLERFAYLTGRSLTVFKKDFEKIFHETPSRWLVQKRLQEAYFQIEKKGKKPSDIYLDLGFEDLSHFSFAFKKQFGVAPSKI